MALQGLSKIGLATALATLGLAAPAGAAGVITTAAGNGTEGYGGDGGPAVAANLYRPESAIPYTNGSFLVADTGYPKHFDPAAPGNRVRRVTSTGLIDTHLEIGVPVDLTRTSGDSYLVVSRFDSTDIVTPASYTLHRVVGGVATKVLTATGAETAPQPSSIADIAQTSDGGTLIADAKANRVIKLSVVGGQLSFKVVAGNGTPGSGGDGGLATEAQLSSPQGVAVLPNGGFLIADTGNNKVRFVSSNGRITTVAGTGVAGATGHCKRPTEAQLRGPVAISVLSNSRYLIADRDNHRIVEVRSTVGTGERIVTVAGRGEAGYTGDGGEPSKARLSLPEDVAVTPDGFLIADTRNNVVRRVTRDLQDAKLCGRSTAPSPTPEPGPGPNPEDVVDQLIGETPPPPSGGDELVGNARALVERAELIVDEASRTVRKILDDQGVIVLPVEPSDVDELVRALVGELFEPDDGVGRLPGEVRPPRLP